MDSIRPINVFEEIARLQEARVAPSQRARRRDDRERRSSARRSRRDARGREPSPAPAGRERLVARARGTLTSARVRRQYLRPSGQCCRSARACCTMSRRARQRPLACSAMASTKGESPFRGTSDSREPGGRSRAGVDPRERSACMDSHAGGVPMARCCLTRHRARVSDSAGSPA